MVKKRAPRKRGRPPGPASARGRAASRRNAKRPRKRRGLAQKQAKSEPWMPSPEQEATDSLFQTERAKLTAAKAARELLKAELERNALVPIEEVQTFLNHLTTSLVRICDTAPVLVESLEGFTADQAGPLRQIAKRLAERLRNAIALALVRAPAREARQTTIDDLPAA
jgi:hypothetical protein